MEPGNSSHTGLVAARGIRSGSALRSLRSPAQCLASLAFALSVTWASWVGTNRNLWFLLGTWCGTKTLQSVCCKELRDQALPEIEAQSAGPYLPWLPGEGSWLEPCLPHPGIRWQWEPPLCQVQSSGRLSRLAGNSVQATGLRLGKCQPSLPARTTPATLPAHWLPPLLVALPAGRHSHCHQGRDRCVHTGKSFSWQLGGGSE